jgi:glutathione S-transferase
MIELYHNDMSTCAQKVRMALAEKGLEWTGHHFNLREGPQHLPDYLALNPGGVVPTLIHDGKVVIESTVINEYIDDYWPENPLRPADPYGRSRMRLWTKRLDEGLHAMTGVLSSSIAFRHQHFAIKTREEVERTIENIPNAAKRERQRENILKGLDSRFLPGAIRAFAQLVSDFDDALAGGDWLVGDEFSLADVNYAPYMVRLDHLQLSWMWEDKPRVVSWFDRLRARDAFRVGISDWFNDAYLPLMAEEGAAAGARIKTMVASN